MRAGAQCNKQGSLKLIRGKLNKRSSCVMCMARTRAGPAGLQSSCLPAYRKIVSLVPVSASSRLSAHVHAQMNPERKLEVSRSGLAAGPEAARR